MQTIQSNSGKYRAEIKTRENVKIIRNSDNHIIHTTGPGHRTLNKFVTIKDQECKDHRSEEHTSELQSPDHLVCRLLLEKKKTTHKAPK